MCDIPRMMIRKRMESCPLHRHAPEGFCLSEVEVRLVMPRERPLRDALMDGHHYPGFRRLAARGLRQFATFRGQWVALAAWQNGASGAGGATAGPGGSRRSSSGGSGW